MKTSISPRSSPLGTFCAEERLQLSAKCPQWRKEWRNGCFHRLSLRGRWLGDDSLEACIHYGSNFSVQHLASEFFCQKPFFLTKCIDTLSLSVITFSETLAFLLECQ